MSDMKQTFKPIFSTNGNVDKNAYLNWRMSQSSQWYNFNAIADGYRDAALTLARSCLEDQYKISKKADELIFPILFNANHAIELYLKSMMWEIYLLENNLKDKYDGGHDIRQLFKTVQKMIADVSDRYGFTDDKKNIKTDLANTEDYINELFLLLHPETNGVPQCKENLDFSRYPVNKAKEPYFYSKDPDKNVTVDIENFINRFTEIGNNLSSIDGYYGSLLDHKMEHEADIQREYGNEMMADMYRTGFEW